MRNYNNADNQQKTLREINGSDWRETSFGSGLEIRFNEVYNTRRLIEYSVEDLRLMIGQKESIEYLIPEALEYLSNCTFLEDELFSGALLKAVSRISDEEYWDNYPDDKQVLIDSIDESIELLQDVKKLLLLSK